MATELLRHEPDYATPPGETLREVLDDLGMTQAELAERTGLSPKHINQVVRGVAALSPDTAVLLEPVVGVPARLWNNLEANYQSQLSAQRERKSAEADRDWLQRLPCAELKRRGVLPSTNNVADLVLAARRFFGVASSDSWTSMWAEPQAAFRLSPSFEPEVGALAAWVRLTELQAQSIDCEPFSAPKLRSALQAVRAETPAPRSDLHRWLVETFAATGVAFVVVPEVKGARVSGAAYWMGNKAVLALSLRYKSDDHFWFSMFHEAGHLLLHPKRDRFIDDGSPSDTVQEQEADQFAATQLIPTEHEPELPTLRTLAAIQNFANRLGIAPGIVVGRLQHDGVITFRVGNKLKRRIQVAA
ncbi:MAG TPA: HigA family addiction module antitoxin [Microthrixaceae bacterium]|nr:HigA family addiction module antitoxin [Microthrixaceae bacterium]